MRAVAMGLQMSVFTLALACGGAAMAADQTAAALKQIAVEAEQSGEYQAVLNELSKLKATEHDADTAFLMAEAAFRTGDLSQAKGLAISAAVSEENRCRALTLLADIYRQSDAFGDMQAAASLAVGADPECAEGYLRLGQALQEQKREKQADAAFTRYTELTQ